MGKGASKSVSSVPIHFAVNIYAAEGLLFEAEKELARIVKAVLEGDESLSGELMDARERVTKYNWQYTNAIKALEYYLRKA